MVCYAKQNKPNEAEKVLREMANMGIQADMVTYTTLIDAYKRAGQIEKCWEIFEEVKVQRPGETDTDEMLLSYMIRLAAATHDSEKALLLFAELENNGFTE